jgi:hypothetical protein
MFLCLMATIGIWLLNSLNRDHLADVSYPIVFKYDDQELMVNSDEQAYISFHTYGMGWDILKLKTQFFLNPIEIEIKSKRKYRYLLSSDVKPYLEDYLPDLEIRYFLSDTLFTGLDKVRKVKMKIYLDREKSFIDKDYKVDGNIIISPEYIIATGPASILDTMSHKITIKLSERGISDNYKEDIAISKPTLKCIQYSTDKVDVSFNVTKYKRPFTD